MRINTNSWTNKSYFDNRVISSSSEMAGPAYAEDNTKQKYPPNQTFYGISHNLSGINNALCNLNLNPTTMQYDLKITDNLRVLAKRAEQLNKTLYSITKNKDENGNRDGMNHFFCLEYDVCIFVQELLQLLNTKTWIEKQKNIFHCVFVFDQYYSSISYLNSIVAFIRNFNKKWSEWFIFTHKTQIHFRESCLLKLLEKHRHCYSGLNGQKNYFGNYNLFQHINTWYFKTEHVSPDVNYMIWEKENMPILVVDTTLKGFVPIIDNLSDSGTMHFYQITLKKLEHISENIDSIKKLLVDFDNPTPKQLYDVLARTKSISAELASENIAFSKKELLSLSIVAKILAELPQLIHIQESDTHFVKFEKTYIFLMWNILIKEYLFGHRIIDNQDKNSGLFMMECLFFLSKTFSKMDMMLLKTAIKLNNKLNIALEQKGVGYQEFLIHFLKQKYIFEEEESNLDYSEQKDYYSKFINSTLEIQSETLHKKNTAGISMDEALYMRISKYMIEYWTHQLCHIDKQNAIYTSNAEEKSSCSTNILYASSHSITNNTPVKAQEINDSWSLSDVNNTIVLDDEQSSETSVFSQT